MAGMVGAAPGAVSDAVLEISDLRVRYGPLEALHGVSLSVPAGSVIAVVGRNGAGKTSLLRAIAGNVRTPSGHITWQGTEITRSAASHRAGQGIILIPEDRGIFQTLTVQENLELFAPSGDVAPALEAFPPLRELLTRKAVLLSGGEQQMLALSRALLTPWHLLLVDELSHGLAPALAARLYNVLADLVADQRQAGTAADSAAAAGALSAGAPPAGGGGAADASDGISGLTGARNGRAVHAIDAESAPAAGRLRAVVLAEPHPREATQLADFLYVLRRGEVVFAGPPADLDPSVL